VRARGAARPPERRLPGCLEAGRARCQLPYAAVVPPCHNRRPHCRLRRIALVGGVARFVFAVPAQRHTLTLEVRSLKKRRHAGSQASKGHSPDGKRNKQATPSFKKNIKRPKSLGEAPHTVCSKLATAPATSASAASMTSSSSEHASSA
jgi:hypothetical protein